jgi:two-component system nitrate/nitrite response regulator NarL
MPVHPPIRVLIVDDHAGIRAGLMGLINSEQPTLCAVGAAASSADALAQAGKQQPDVIVLDVNLGGEDGLALMPALQRAAPCEVVVLTSLLDPRVEAHARLLGAHACLHKTAPAAELLAAILAARPATLSAHDPHPSNAGGDLSRLARSNYP